MKSWAKWKQSEVSKELFLATIVFGKNVELKHCRAVSNNAESKTCAHLQSHFSDDSKYKWQFWKMQAHSGMFSQSDFWIDFKNMWHGHFMAALWVFQQFNSTAFVKCKQQCNWVASFAKFVLLHIIVEFLQTGHTLIWQWNVSLANWKWKSWNKNGSVVCHIEESKACKLCTSLELFWTNSCSQVQVLIFTKEQFSSIWQKICKFNFLEF